MTGKGGVTRSDSMNNDVFRIITKMLRKFKDRVYSRVLKSLEHMGRMNDGKMVKRVMKAGTSRYRPRGRPRGIGPEEAAYI